MTTDREAFNLHEGSKERVRKIFPEEIIELNSGQLKEVSQFRK